MLHDEETLPTRPTKNARKLATLRLPEEQRLARQQPGKAFPVDSAQAIASTRHRKPLLVVYDPAKHRQIKGDWPHGQGAAKHRHAQVMTLVRPWSFPTQA